jgi:hypothetical protein
MKEYSAWWLQHLQKMDDTGMRKRACRHTERGRIPRSEDNLVISLSTLITTVVDKVV